MIQHLKELDSKNKIMTEIENIEKKSRRSGGRSARRMERSSPLPENIKPVKAGMIGGTYNPLSPQDVTLIENSIFRLLEEVGMSQAPESGIKKMIAYGAKYGEDGRLRFPSKVIQKALDATQKNITIYGQTKNNDLHLGPNRVHYGTAGAAVNVVDSINKSYRASEAQDIYNAAKIAEKMDNIHFFQRPMVANDISDPHDMDINTLYACISGTTKHVGVSYTEASFVNSVIDILHSVAGGKSNWESRPFVSNSNAFVVPPLRYAPESCLVMEEVIKHGMPVLLLSAGQAGATAPASIAGTVVQAVSEVLGGLVYVNSISPGHTCIAGTWPFVSDLRTGAMSGGSGEQGLLTGACAQMLRHFNLSSGSAAGMTDSKLPDAQSGYEKGSTAVMAGLAGLNLVYESVGMHASLLGFSLESMIIDNDMLGQCLRCVRGIEVNENTLSFDAIKEVCLEGPGHFLGHQKTLEVMQSEYIYPENSDRTSPKEWNENGKPEIILNAHSKVNQILDTFIPSHIDDKIDKIIRTNYNIKFKKN